MGAPVVQHLGVACMADRAELGSHGRHIRNEEIDPKKARDEIGFPVGWEDDRSMGLWAPSLFPSAYLAELGQGWVPRQALCHFKGFGHNPTFFSLYCL